MLKVVVVYYAQCLLDKITTKYSKIQNYVEISGSPKNIKSSTVEPGINKLFQKHKKFSIARCLLAKGFDQMSNMCFSTENVPCFK